MMSDVKNSYQKSKGFTLVEMAIVMAILGILVASFLTVYTGYLERKRIEDTESDIQAIANAVDSYFQQFGFYPCPARRDLGYGAADFGVATDCSAPVGAGVFELGGVGIDTDGDGAVDDNVDLRFGAVPFDDLSLFIDYNALADGTSLISRRSRVRGENTIDAYGNQYTYVVTVGQATDDFQDGRGGVQIYDEFAATPLTAADVPVLENGDFIIVSHGENGIGAWNSNGNLVADCTTGLSNEERENCDQDEFFTDSLRYDNQGGGEFYDDHLAHAVWFPYFLWEESPVNANAINPKNSGFVGVGADDPQDKLHIKDGNLQAFNVFGAAYPPPVGAEVFGGIQAQQICKEDGTDCFDPEELIDGTSIMCPLGQSMTGMAGNAPICTPVNVANYNRDCGAGNFISSYSYNVGSNSWSSTCSAVPPTVAP